MVGGVNGDFYDMSTGNTLGVLISDGVLRSTSGGFYAVGFREDGSAFIGWPAISVTATFSGYTLQVTDVNKTRTALSNSTPGGYYLYTDDYSKTTQHTSPGIDVILSPGHRPSGRVGGRGPGCVRATTASPWSAPRIKRRTGPQGGRDGPRRGGSEALEA